MRKTTYILAGLAVSALIAGCASSASHQDLDADFAAMMKSSFRDQGIAKTDRLTQDLGQAACSSPNPPPVRFIKRLAAFFEAEMRDHRVRRHDAEIVARAFLGGLQSYVFFELLLKAQDELPLPAEMHVRGLVNLLWNGLSPTVKKGA